MVWELTFVLGSSSAQAQKVEAAQHETRRDIALAVLSRGVDWVIQQKSPVR